MYEFGIRGDMAGCRISELRYASMENAQTEAEKERVEKRLVYKRHVSESEKSEVAQLCPTLCDPMDCSLPGSSVHDFPGNSTGVDCHFLLQGIFPTQGSNPGLLHCRQTLNHLRHQGSP